MITRNRLEELVLPLLSEDSGLELIEIRLAGDHNRLHVTVLLDRRDGAITLEECVHWSRRFEEAFDIAPDFPRRYALDVSSPGVDRPLEKDWQFTKNIGRTLELELRSEEETAAKPVTRRVVLQGVRADCLEVEDGELIPRRHILQAKVALPW